jgi:hypothetical protein
MKIFQCRRHQGDDVGRKSIPWQEGKTGQFTKKITLAQLINLKTDGLYCDPTTARCIKGLCLNLEGFQLIAPLCLNPAYGHGSAHH